MRALLCSAAALLGLTSCSDDAAPSRFVPPLQDGALSDTSVSAGEADASLEGDAGAALDATIVDARAADDAALDASALAGPLAWESATTTLDDGKILVEKVSYRSEGLLVYGQICRPHPALAGSTQAPVQIVNHGGFSGIPAWNGGNCVNLARQGWVAAESSYRGEDGSEGKVEVCLGEVTDVLRLTSIVLAQPYADPKRVLMSGISHGGCITTRAVQRGAPVHMAVDIFGPNDWASAYAGWREALEKGAPQAASYRLLIAALEQATGGTPAEVPEQYARRSPRSFAADLDRALLPFLVFQGASDAFVPNEQACGLAAVSQGFESFHVGLLGIVNTSVPAGCASANLTWQPGPRPTSWPKDRYLMLYDDVGHNFEGSGTSTLLADLNTFLAARFPK